MDQKSNFQKTIGFLNSLSDERTKVWFSVETPYFALVSVALYLLTVIFGPKIMKNRKPFSLKLSMIWYNFFLVIWSAYMCILFIRYGVINSNFNILCYVVDYSAESYSIMFAWAVYLYYISKLVELLDTIFFILRKKNNQITFLHVYHHATMPLLWWFGVKYVGGGESYLSPMVNCFVHVLMYAYYGLSAFGPWIQPYLWWKKYITVVQMVQFVIVITKTLVTLATSCSFPKVYLWGQLFYMLSLLILFLDFYRHAYKEHQKKREDHGLTNTANGLVEFANHNHQSVTKSTDTGFDITVTKRG